MLGTAANSFLLLAICAAVLGGTDVETGPASTGGCLGPDTNGR